MIDSISKPKLPKGRSYPLRASQITEVLTAAHIDAHVDLAFWTPQGGESILEAHYWRPNENVPYPRVYLRAGSLPSDQRVAAADALASEVLPAFVVWLKKILALPSNSPALLETLYLNARFIDRRVRLEYEPKYKIPR